MSQYPSSRVKLVSNIDVLMRNRNMLNLMINCTINSIITIIIGGQDYLIVLLHLLIKLTLRHLGTNPILSNIKNESTVKRPNSSTKRHRPIPPATLPKLAKFHYI